jgi:hypothetical protein
VAYPPELPFTGLNRRGGVAVDTAGNLSRRRSQIVGVQIFSDADLGPTPRTADAFASTTR